MKRTIRRNCDHQPVKWKEQTEWDSGGQIKMDFMKLGPMLQIGKITHTLTIYSWMFPYLSYIWFGKNLLVGCWRQLGVNVKRNADNQYREIFQGVKSRQFVLVFNWQIFLAPIENEDRKIVWVVVVVHLLSCVWLFVTPWTAAWKSSLSFNISQSLHKFMSVELVMPSNRLIL